MLNRSKRAIVSLVTAVTAFSAAGCDEPARVVPQDAAANTPAPVTPAPTPTPTPDPDPFVPEQPKEELGFSMGYVLSDSYTYRIYDKDKGLDAPCRAELGDDISCYLDAKELDLYFFGATIWRNAPKSMGCEYTRFSPYYYYGWQVGDGPTGVTFSKAADGKVVPASVVINPPGLATVSSGGTVTCKYDYGKVKGPNCCLGTYTLSVTENGETSVTEPEWGGDPSKCIDGPAVQTQRKDLTGFPMADIHYVGDTGLSKSYEIKAPIMWGRAFNVFAANFFPGATPAPMAAPSASVLWTRAPEKYYEFECLDRAWEVLSRIRLQIREYNTDEAWETDGDPDEGCASSINLGAGCFEPDYPDRPINDREDWGDLGNTFPKELLLPPSGG